LLAALVVLRDGFSLVEPPPICFATMAHVGSLGRT
jgi:hypothetical protein